MATGHLTVVRSEVIVWFGDSEIEKCRGKESRGLKWWAMCGVFNNVLWLWMRTNSTKSLPGVGSCTHCLRSLGCLGTAYVAKPVYLELLIDTS